MFLHFLLRHWILTLALVISMAFIGIKYLSIEEPKLVDTRGMAVPSNSPSRVVEVTLLSSPKISRTTGDPHSPFGVHGKNRYVYDGKIQLENSQYYLQSEGHEPIAGVKTKSELFLVTQGYYFKESFMFFRSDESNVLRPIAIQAVPREFWKLSFREHNQTCAFRVGLLNSLAKNGSTELAIECFCLLADIDGRFGLMENWRDRSKVPSQDIQSFVRNVVLPSNNSKTVPALVKMIDGFTNNDNPTTMSYILYCLLQFDQKVAKTVICKFRSSIPDLTDQADMRSLALMDTPALHNIDCQSSASNASTGM